MTNRDNLDLILRDLTKTAATLDPVRGYAYIAGTYEVMLIDLVLQLPEEKQKVFMQHLIAAKTRIITNAQEKARRDKI